MAKNKDYLKGFQTGYMKGFYKGIKVSRCHPADIVCAKWNAKAGYQKYSYDIFSNTIISVTGTGLYFDETVK